MANAVVNRQVNVYINSGEAAKAYDVLIKREKLLNEELKKTSDPKRIKQLNAELDKLKEPIDRAAKKMKGELAPSIRELEMATRKFLNEFKKTGSPEALANFQKFRAELAKAKADISGLDNSSKGLTSKGVFSGAFWGSLAAGAVTAAASAIGNFFRGVIQEALDADESTRRLQSTLDNMGRGDAFDRINRKADELAAKFKYLDNDDIVGVFNKLIDYGKLTEQEMNNLLPVIIDFAAKSNISIDESSSVIIKALEGNGKALKEYGIDIKDAGSETERLNTIMTTLKEKVDGSGEAFQNSAKGGILTARQELKNLQEEIGNYVIPALNKLLSFVINAIKKVKEFFFQIKDGFQDSFRINVIDRLVKRAVNRNLRGEVDAAAEEAQKAFDEEMVKRQDEAKIKLGTGDKGKGDKKTPAAPKKNDAEEKRKAEEKAYAEFLKRLKEMDADFDISQQEGFEKDMALLMKKFDALNEEAKKHKNNKEALLAIDELYRKETMALIDKYELIDKAKYEEAVKDKAQMIEKAYATYWKAMQAGMAIIREDKLAANDLAILEARGKKRLLLKIAQLKREEEEEVKAAIKRANDAGVTEEQVQNIIAGIRKKYRGKEEDEQLAFFQNLIGKIQEYGSLFLNELAFWDQIKTQNENNELARDRSLNDAKKANLERRLKAGLITQFQYNRELEQLARKQEKKEREIAKEQFERNKRMEAAQAFISGQGAVLKAMEIFGPPIPPNFAGIIAFALTEGLAIAKTAAILNQKPPVFADGGMLGGRSHASGGNAVVDGSGRKIAEVEAGEGIVNKRTMADRRQYQVSGTPGQIISRLNSMHGVSWEGGATLVPAWRSFRPQPMNFAAMKSVYASGGVFTSPTPSNTENIASQNAIFENFSAMVSDMQATTQYLANVLAKGIKADVSLLRFEEQQDRLAAIRADATMVG